MACNPPTDDQHEEIQTVHISNVTEDDAEPPPPGFTSKFNTVTEWLTNICEIDKPKKSISTYNFGLFETPGDYILFLVGKNQYEIGKDHSAIRIEFEPTNMYFLLPKEYQALERQQVLDRLTAQLKAFINTAEFKHSFLSEAQTITTDFGGVIWTKGQ